MDFTLISLLFCAAMLYSSVGHGGASAYLAIMAFYGFAPEEMRATALVLNLLVSSLAFWRFYRAGAFDTRLLICVAIAAIPMAFLGGLVPISPQYYRPIIGVILLFSAVIIWWRTQPLNERKINRPKPVIAAGAGGFLGLLAGLTGTGGGIFLSPLMIFSGWADARKTAGVAAAFIFCNSVAGLAGQIIGGNAQFRADLPVMLIAVGLGGALGSTMSAQWLPRQVVLKLTAIVLVIAGGKLLML